MGEQSSYFSSCGAVSGLILQGVLWLSDLIHKEQ